MSEASHVARGARSARLALPGLLAIVFIDALSYSMIMPLLPFLVMASGGDAWWGGLVATIHALAAALGAPILGGLSDRFGRRAMLMITLGGTVAAYGLLLVSASIPALLAVRAFSGAMAGNMGIVSAGIADVTSEEQRARGMSLSTAAWALGFVVGPGLSSVLSGLGGTPLMLLPSLAAAGATLSSLILVGATLRDMAPSPPSPEGEGERADARPEILGLFGYLTALALCQSGLVSMTGFWAASVHGWGQRQVSLLMLWAALGVIAVQVLLVARLAQRFGELTTLLIGLALAFVGCASLVIAPKSLVMLAVAAPLMFGGITMGQAMANTRLSRISSAGRLGARMGRASAASAVGRIIGPTAGGAVFMALGPAAIYGAVMVVTAGGIASRFLSRREPKASHA